MRALQNNSEAGFDSLQSGSISGHSAAGAADLSRVDDFSRPMRAPGGAQGGGAASAFLQQTVTSIGDGAAEVINAPSRNDRVPGGHGELFPRQPR